MGLAGLNSGVSGKSQSLVDITFSAFSCGCNQFCHKRARGNGCGKPGYFIHQRSAFLGRRDVYLTDSGFMAINHVSGHILITRAPDWKVQVANLRSKLYFITPFDTWMGRKVALGEKTVRGPISQKPRPISGSRTICGLRAERLKLDSSDGLEKRYINGHRDLNDFDKVEYWITPDLPFPKPAQQTILIFYQLPTLSSFSGGDLFSRQAYLEKRPGFQPTV